MKKVLVLLIGIGLLLAALPAADRSADEAAIRRAMEAICAVPYPDDGVVFDPGSIRIDDIRDAQELALLLPDQGGVSRSH